MKPAIALNCVLMAVNVALWFWRDHWWNLAAACLSGGVVVGLSLGYRRLRR